MRIASNRCPTCNAPFELPSDGRMSFFCSYCGTQIVLEEYPGIEDLLRIKEADTKLKEADAKLKKASAKELYANAKSLDADVRHMREVERIQGTKHKHRWLLILGIVFILIGIASVCFSVYYYHTGVLTNKAAIAIALFGVLFFIFFGVEALVDGVEKEDPDKAKKLNEEKQKLEMLKKKLEEQRQIVISCGNALWGKNAEKKRFAKQRIKAISQEIKETEERIKKMSE